MATAGIDSVLSKMRLTAADMANVGAPVDLSKLNIAKNSIFRGSSTIMPGKIGGTPGAWTYAPVPTTDVIVGNQPSIMVPASPAETANVPPPAKTPTETSKPVTPSIVPTKLTKGGPGVGYIPTATPVSLSDGTTQLTGFQPGIVAAAARQGNNVDMGGGNVSQFSMSPEQQAEVQARRDANIAQLKTSGEAMDEMNALAAAHGPAEAAQAMNQIAKRRTSNATASMVPWEIKKTQSEIEKNVSAGKMYAAHAGAYEALQNKGDDAKELQLQKETATLLQQGLPIEEVNTRIDALRHVLSGDQFIPGTPAKKGGLFEKDVPATPGRWVPKGSAQPQSQTPPSGFTELVTSNGRTGYRNPQTKQIWVAS